MFDIVAKLGLLLLALCFVSCDMMPIIIAEMDQIDEACEIADDPALYSGMKVDPKTEMIVKYRLVLDPQKRHYVSSCGIHVSKKEARFLKGEAMEPIVVARQAYIAVKRNQPSFSFHMLCMVGGLTSHGNDVDGSPRKIVISPPDTRNSCTIAVDRSVKPVVLGARDQFGKLEIEKE